MAQQNGGGGGLSEMSPNNHLSVLSSGDRDYLLSPDGNQVKVSDLEGKVVGLYFSANWYLPCKDFNEFLVSAYQQLKTAGANFEVVFVSSDENLEAFDEYRASMPWLSVPFLDVETKKALNSKDDVDAVPCLIILQPSLNNEAPLLGGVEILHRFGDQAFPFNKERLEELELVERLKHERQTLVNLSTTPERDFLLGHPAQETVASLEGKTIGLYFSAQWCLPCQKFTPKLISAYHKINQLLADKPNEGFEVVFVSSDENQSEFHTYFTTMPWLAVPFGDTTIETLAKLLDVKDIPCLVILGPNGKTVTMQGRNLVSLYQDDAYPFTGDQVELLEREIDEEAKSLPSSELHLGHRHELNLVSEGNGGGPFICCDCDEQGSSWAYQCLECGYEVHPKCVRVMGRSPVAQS